MMAETPMMVGSQSLRDHVSELFPSSVSSSVITTSVCSDDWDTAKNEVVIYRIDDVHSFRTAAVLTGVDETASYSASNGVVWVGIGAHDHTVNERHLLRS